MHVTQGEHDLTPRWFGCARCRGVLPPGACSCLWLLAPACLWPPRPSELWPCLLEFWDFPCLGVLPLLWLEGWISTSWNPPPLRRALSGGPPFWVRLSLGVGVAWTRIWLGLSSAEAPFPISFHIPCQVKKIKQDYAIIYLTHQCKEIEYSFYHEPKGVFFLFIFLHLFLFGLTSPHPLNLSKTMQCPKCEHICSTIDINHQNISCKFLHISIRVIFDKQNVPLNNTDRK